ncbi:unnamed protein product [Urochloa decumbens]|uniref:Bifunctional inhibitor/plant lipid transfer protein/seed storage helical domain-containing protein n=1 Tax=Urochloa decumbens TaxID=240449 RepID=A0ABC8YQW9_9POAL
MAKLLRLFSILGFLVAMSIVGTQQAAGGCNIDFQGLVKECKHYVMHPDNPKIHPSAGCCGEVKKADDILCLCSMVNEKIEKLVSMEKVVYVTRECGIPVKPGFQCGSYTVPNI